ncbi:T9SS type A sorting domain-containing protein [Chryseobacterium tructae]|uniref:T9SS type A sorting domain-containing protein n=1 Tax=Chryseobacterium tructae TaxID=1037380 RepID=A0ABV7XUF8_9FLAO|nr:T9SS type A sorting domain-containing protein [Chryseobacterium tructae]MDN3691227.1 T9SS type A sorting domain-containing protein [Chryseobacterium tructae]
MNQKKLLILFTTGLAVSFSAQCANPANVNSYTYNGKVYEVIKELKNWNDAALCAVQRGGYLVEINDANEQNAIYNFITSSGISSTYAPVSDGGGTSYVWIGATDRVVEGSWLWDGNNDGVGINFWNGQGAAGSGNGMPVSNRYNNWGRENGTGMIMEPDNYLDNQNAAAIALSGWPSGSNALGVSGQWNDLNMSNSLYYVVEKDNQTLGVADNSHTNKDQLKIYPNPVKAGKNLMITSVEAGAYTLLSPEGKVLKTGKISTNTDIDTSALPVGIYIITIETRSDVKSYKVIVK